MEAGCGILVVSMILAVTLLLSSVAAPLADCVPARWDASDPGTLRLLKNTPINCILLEKAHWNDAFLKAAQEAGLRVLPVVRSADEASAALALKPSGLVLQGTFAAPSTALPVVRIAPRGDLSLAAPIEGTAQGLWPGIRAESEGMTAALPTGAPWIETNGGFLRFVRAVLPAESVFWMAMRPPAGQALRGRNYFQALADANFNGAAWVLALDEDFREGLFAGDERFVNEWHQIARGLRFLAEAGEYARWREHGSLALIQDSDTGGLFSGGFLDMLAARHIPATITPSARIATTTKVNTQVLLNTDPAPEGSDRKKQLLDLAKKGITIFNSPLDWNPGRPGGDAFTFLEGDVKVLADAWREINSMLGRRNFGLRVFGAPSTLSNLKVSPDGKKLAIHLLNYSDYPVQDISLHLLGKFTKARMLTPTGESTPAVYPIEEGIEIEVARLADVAVIVVE